MRRTGYPCCPAGSHFACHYAANHYDPRLVCFRCRTTWKKPAAATSDACRTCGQRASEVGVGFAAPPKRRVSEWRALEARFRRGEAFLCCSAR